jgi:hypothetical protein
MRGLLPLKGSWPPNLVDQPFFGPGSLPASLKNCCGAAWVSLIGPHLERHSVANR